MRVVCRDHTRADYAGSCFAPQFPTRSFPLQKVASYLTGLLYLFHIFASFVTCELLQQRNAAGVSNGAQCLRTLVTDHDVIGDVSQHLFKSRACLRVSKLA